MVIIMLVVLTLVTWTGLETYAAEGKGPLAALSLEIPVAHADDDWGDGNWNHRGRGDEDFWEDVHEFTVSLMLALIFIHIAGVIVSSLLHGENLPRSMISGRKRILKSE